MFSSLISPILLLITGLIGLVFSSDYLVRGAASVAKIFGMKPSLIGMTIIAFGTSAPEMVVSGGAAIEGASDLGVGNALGSNIANIGLVLAILALFAKLPVERYLFKTEIPLLIVATALATFFLLDLKLTRTEGIILLVSGVLYPFILIYSHKIQAMPEPDFDDDIPDIHLQKALTYVAGGLVVLLLSADVLVNAATDIATYFEVSPMIIGLTIVALGTSLPELAASVASVLNGHKDMAVGNIIGSNILNIFLVMSLPALIAPPLLDKSIIDRDVYFLCGFTLTLIFIVMAKSIHSKPSKLCTVGVFSGLLFLSGYIAYYALIFFQTFV